MAVELTAAEIAGATGGELVAGTGRRRSRRRSRSTRVCSRPGACFVALRGDARRARLRRRRVRRAVRRSRSSSRAVELPASTPDAARGRRARRTTRWRRSAISPARRGERLEHADGRRRSPARRARPSTKDLTAGAARAGAAGAREPGLVQQRVRAAAHAAHRRPDDARSSSPRWGSGSPATSPSCARSPDPTIGVVTNVGLAHAEHLGGRDGVAAVMGELLDALPAERRRGAERRRRAQRAARRADRGPGREGRARRAAPTCAAVDVDARRRAAPVVPARVAVGRAPR